MAAAEEDGGGGGSSEQEFRQQEKERRRRRRRKHLRPPQPWKKEKKEPLLPLPVPRGASPCPEPPARCCPLCQADVSALDAPRRHQHQHQHQQLLRRCHKDEAAAAEDSPREATTIPECPLCGKAFRSVRGRKSHLKNCAAKMGVPPALLVQAVRQQQQQQQELQPSSCSSSSSCPPGHSHLPSAPRLKRKMFSSVENLAKKPKIVSKVEGADEDLLVAMAMSRSLFEKEKATAKQLSRGKKSRAKPSSSPPPLLLQDPQKMDRDMEGRLAQMFWEVGELRSTPPLLPSHLLKTEQLRTAEARQGGSLWESSSLTGPCLPASFMAPGLVLPPLSQLPGSQSLAVLTLLPIPGPVVLQETDYKPTEANPSQGRDDQAPGDPSERQALGEWGQEAHLALVDLAEDETACPSQELEESDQVQEEEETRSSSSSQQNRGPPRRRHPRLALLASLADAFGRMLNSPHLSDIQFRVGGGEILHAHKFVLYARCPLLLEECEASQVGIALADGGAILTYPLLLSDFSREAVSTFLNYLYTADPIIPPHLRADVAFLATRFAVKDLVALCREDQSGLEVYKEGQAGDGGHGKGHGKKVFNELLESWWLDVDSEALPEGAPVEVAAKAPPPFENMSQEELEEIYEFVASQQQAGEDRAQDKRGGQDDGRRSGQGKMMDTGGISSRDRMEDPLEDKGASRREDPGLPASGGKGELSRPLGVEEMHLEAEEEEEEEEQLFRAALEASMEGPCSDAEEGCPRPSPQSPHTQGPPRASSDDVALDPPNFPPLGWELLPRSSSPGLRIMPSAPSTPPPMLLAAPALLPGAPWPTLARWGCSSQSRAVPVSSPVQTPSGAAETLPHDCSSEVVLVLDSEDEEGPKVELAGGGQPRAGSVSLGPVSLEPPSQGREIQGAESPLCRCGSSPLGQLSRGAESPSGLTLVPDTPLPLVCGSSSPWVGWSSWRWPGSPGSGARPSPCSPSSPGRPPAKAPLPCSTCLGRETPSGRRSSSSFQEAEVDVVVLEDSEEEADSPLAASGEEEGAKSSLAPWSPAAPWSHPGCPLEGADSSEDELRDGAGENSDGGSSSSTTDLFLPLSQRGFKVTSPEKPLDGACLAKETFCTADPQTPMPSYSTMVTPELKKELKRFGVRALPKQQMVLKLKEIFRFTREQEGEAAPPPLQAQRAPAADTRTKPAAESIQPSSHMSRLGTLGELPFGGDARQGRSKAAGIPLGSSPEKGPVSLVVSHGSVGSEAWQSSSSTVGQALALGAAEEPDHPPPASQSRDHHEADQLEALRHHLRSSPVLCQRVLQYQPIELSALQADLKGNGISIALSRLLEFLDVLCITFTTAESRREKRSPQKRKGCRRS